MVGALHEYFCFEINSETRISIKTTDPVYEQQLLTSGSKFSTGFSSFDLL